MEAKDTSDEDNNHKRKTEEGFSNDCNDVFEQPTKRICLPLSGQTQITGFFLHENKQRLFRLLCELARQKNWEEMSGVVSTLLRGTVGKVPPILHRKKYWASMEILSRIKSSGYSPTKIRCIYETWISKQALRANYSVKRGFMIQLEFALYCVMQGNLQDAHNAIKFIVRGRDSGSDSIVNLMAGLISYQVWYSGIPKAMQLKNSDEFIQTGTCGVDANGGFCKKSEPDEYSFDHNAVKSQGVKFSFQHASDESIQNEVSSPMDPDNNTPMKQSHHVLPQNKFYTNGSAELSEHEDSFLNHDKLGDACISLPYDIINDMGDILSLVVNEAENGLSIFCLDVTLLPIQRQQLKEDPKYTCLSNEGNEECYVDAVRNLQDALCSNPPLLAALLPLIQLLLLNGHVEEALDKLEKFCKESNAVLPFRLRASLLECFGRTNPLMLATCYEDILKKDPRCCSSLAGLIRLYKNGEFGKSIQLGRKENVQGCNYLALHSLASLRFMEDHNTATFSSKKYYNLDAYYQRKMAKEMKKGSRKVKETERTVFNDEEQRRQELLMEREKQKEAQVEALKRSMQSGMAQAMKEQAQLREEMTYQYRIGNFEAAAAIQKRLDPDAAL